MRKSLIALSILISASNICASNPQAEDENWARNFSLSSGFNIVRTPESVHLIHTGIHFESPNISFDKNTSINEISPSAYGKLSIYLSLDQFRSEACKFGSIVSEQVIDFPVEYVRYRLSGDGNLPLLPFVITGLSSFEPTHTWTTNKSVVVTIPTFYEGKRVRSIAFLETGGLIGPQYEQEVTVSLERRIIGKYKYSLPHSPTNTIKVSLPETTQANREIIFSIPKTT